MSTLAVLCSGQGNQHAGMFDLVAGSEAAAPVFAAAKEALDGRDPRDLVRGADAATLHGNRVGQVLCCTRALAVWRVLDAAEPGRRVVIAGYSVGEVAAWACAGLFDAETLMRLVVARARAMDEAMTEPGGLASVRGLRREALEAVCRPRDAHVAIVAGEDHFIVGGRRDALDRLCDEARAEGAGRASVIPVNVAAHTPLLGEASERFGAVLRELDLKERMPAGVRLLSGIDGATVFDVKAGLDKLARQVARTVDWAACLASCRAAGATAVIELGPGAALAGMASAAIPDARAHAVEEFRSIDGVRAWLRRG